MYLPFRFVTDCPYCGTEGTWWFGSDNLGSHVVECYQCKRRFVIQIDLIPKVSNVYKLVSEQEKYER